MTSVESHVQRFIKAMKEGNDMRKLHSIISSIPKDDFIAWKDANHQDVMHYAVIFGNVEAVDFLLKLGYFAFPYEPQVNMYAHLAARLGFRNVMCTILQYRPGDFKVAQQPMILPSDFVSNRHGNSRKVPNREIDLGMPAVVGNQLFAEGKGTPARLKVQASVRGSSDYRREVSTTSVDSPRKIRISETANETDTSSNWYFSTRPLMKLSLSYQLNKRRFSYPPEESSGLTFLQDYRQMKSKPLQCTPLEVAARSRHLDCVKVLLDMYVLRAHPEKGSKGYITLAALANNAASLTLLLEPYIGGTSDHSVREDYRAAVQVCVQNVYTECLEVLLNTELVDSKAIFKHINYYHIMYSQPLSSHQAVITLARLPAMTQNLINRGHDVRVKVPPRTYALYSLLDNALSCSDFSLSDYIITCIKLLMDHGADPNFDEVENERLLPPNYGGGRNFGGRFPYSSALHCVIQSLERNHPICKGQAIRFVEECVDVLTSYNANIEILGSINVENYSQRGDVLWQFARSSVRMGLERGLFHCLTRYGSQPQRKINGQFALNVYLDTLCELLKSDAANAIEHVAKRERDVSQMISLMCSFMAPWHIKAVGDVFNYKHKKCTGQAHELLKSRVNEALTKQSKLIHTLRTMTAWQVWKLCQRKADNVKKLPIAKDLKMNVLPLVLFQTLW